MTKPLCQCIVCGASQINEGKDIKFATQEDGLCNNCRELECPTTAPHFIVTQEGVK